MLCPSVRRYFKNATRVGDAARGNNRHFHGIDNLWHKRLVPTCVETSSIENAIIRPDLHWLILTRPLARVRSPIKMYNFAIYKRSGFKIKRQIRNFFNAGQSPKRAELFKKIMGMNRIHRRIHNAWPQSR
jgi:hypothetical protein